MRFLYLLIFLILTTSVYTQEIEDYIYELPYVKHFSYKEYNMHAQCWCAVQDSSNKLYITNSNGIAVFDGNSWTEITLNNAWAIANVNGNIYASSKKIYSIKEQSNGKYKVKELFIDKEKYNISNIIFDRSYTVNNKVYFSNTKELVEVSNEKITEVYNIKGKTHFLYDDKIIINNKHNIVSLDGVELTGINNLKSINTIFTYKKRAYIVVNGIGIYKAELGKNKYDFKNLRLIYSSKYIKEGFSSDIKLNNGNVLMPINIGGIIVYNLNTKNELYINRSTSKNIGRIKSIYITNNKNIIANTDNGFFHINYNTPIKYLKNDKLIKSIVTSFISYNDYIYITTLSGLFKLKKQGNSNKYSIKKLNKTFDSFLDLSTNNNKLYVSSRYGVFEIINDELKQKTNNNIVFGFAFSKIDSSILYVGSKVAIRAYKEKNGKFKQIFSIDKLATTIFRFIEHNNFLWFKYSDSEIGRIPINNTIERKIQIFDLTRKNIDLNLNDNKIFVTSSDGRVCHAFNYNTNVFERWDKYVQISNNDTTYYNDFNKINDQSYFAISNNLNSITKIINTNNSTIFIDKPYRTAGNNQYFSTYYDSTNQKFWVGSSDYIITANNKNKLIKTENKNITYIRSIIVNDTINNLVKEIKPKSSVKFTFSSSNIYKLDENLFSYKLDGFDTQWTTWNKETFTKYTNLDHGSYTFKVKSKDIYSNVSEITEYTFIIKPAFYQTGIAHALAVILLLLIIYLIVYLNSKRLKNINIKLEEQVAERTKEIKNKNTELEKLSVVASETDNSVLIYDADCNLEWINEGEIKNFGYTLEQIWETFGTNLTDISFYPKIKEVLKELKETKKTIHYNSSGHKISGELIWTRTALTPILDEKGNIKKIISIDSDITEIKIAEEKITNQNKLINHSIEYAKRIQTAVLPTCKSLLDNVKDAFILFKPKDIVSGDFYWYYTKNEKTIIVSADSTGHGVPGGFMSMIGNTILNNIIKENGVFEPSKILDYLNAKINSIVNKDSETGQTDGMDVSIALIDKKNNSLELAAANQNIFVIENNKLLEFEGDIWSIGGVFNEDSQNNFTSKKYTLNKISNLYFSTDGYYDQFGGENDKKLMKDIFIDLIIKNYKLPMQNQKIVFETFLDTWKGETKQTDDIQVIGIEL